MSYIEFRKLADKPKTNVWGVFAVSSGDQLGRIAWYGPWRRYIFEPEPDTTWSHDCLADVGRFLSSKNAAHRSRKARPQPLFTKQGMGGRDDE